MKNNLEKLKKNCLLRPPKYCQVITSCRRESFYDEGSEKRHYKCDYLI